MTAQIFLYRDGARLSAEDLKALREAGLVPIKVAKFEDVRIIDPLMAAGSGSAVWLAAIEAIHKHGSPDAGNKGPKSLFGELLAAKLADATVFGSDGKARGT
jgi:hypothetical protein